MLIYVIKLLVSRPEKHLIDPDQSELELGEVNMNFEEILTDEQWIDDATGLIPHCLAILKTCRYLTERLTALAMNSTPLSGNFSQIVEVQFEWFMNITGMC